MSAPKLPVDLTRRTQNDVRSILLYTLREWGEEQEARYAVTLRRAFATIGDNPEIGRVRDDIRPGYRAYPVGQHIILYQIKRNAVLISRIIHSRSDARRALRPRR